MAKAKSPIPEGFHTVTPQLILDNCAEAIDWYKKGLGAEETGRALGPDGQDPARRASHRQFADHGQRRDDGRERAEGDGRLPHLALDLRGGRGLAVQSCRGRGGPSAAGTDGGDGGSILGRPLRNVRRPGGPPLDDRDPQGGLDASGNEAAAG